MSDRRPLNDHCLERALQIGSSRRKETALKSVWFSPTPKRRNFSSLNCANSQTRNQRSLLPRIALFAVSCFVTTAALEAQVFWDDFSYSPLPPTLDSTANWSASSAVTVTGSSPPFQVATVPVDSTNPALFMKPSTSSGGVEVPASWPLARIYEKFLRVEFDVLPAGAVGTSGRVMLILDSIGNSNMGYGDTGALVAGEFDWTNPLGGSNSLTFNVFLKPNGIGSQPVSALASAINLGSFAGVPRKFRIDFGWDYFRLPNEFANPYSNSHSKAEPWFYVRLWEKTGTTWNQLYSRPGYTHGGISTGDTDGWIECGSETPTGNLGGDKTGISKSDWTSNPPLVYPYWYFDQNSGSSTVTWLIDNVLIKPVDPPLPAYSIMVNQLGYDTSGPQWAVLRANDPALRDLPSNITSIDWTITGNGILSQAMTVTNPIGEPCFMEVTDPEDFQNGGYDQASGFHLLQVFWWRWEWNRITVPATGCVVQAVIHTPAIPSVTIVSDPFSISPHLAYSNLIASPNSNVALQNGVQRTAVITSHTTDVGGWFDANAENGENRSQSLFLSAFANLLMRRRPQLSTSEIHDLIGQVVLGADFVTSLGYAENQYATNPPTSSRSHTTIQNSKQDQAHDCTTPTPPPEEMNGHIWHESHKRAPGHSPEDTNDKKNTGSNEWMSCVALLDAARALTPFGTSFGTSQVSSYVSQAVATRTYMLWLAGHFGHSAHPDYYFTYRSMAMLDFIYSEVDPSSGALASAGQDIYYDLIQYQPSSDDSVKWYWIMADQFNLVPGGNNDIGSIDCPLYCPADPIMYCIEHGISDPPPPAMPWVQAISNIVDYWYDSVHHLRPNTLHPNPLRIANFWSPIPTPSKPGNTEPNELETYYGNRPFRTKDVAHEGYAAARFAQVLRRADSRFDRLVQLATGNLNYLLGINIGIRARQVLQASGVPPTDLEYGGVSLIQGVGSHWGAQVVRGLEVWNQFTTMNGPAGRASNLAAGDYQDAPWEYSRGTFTGAETFIKTDASVISLIDTLDRVLHPQLVVEAESITPPPPVTAIPNNDASTNRYNGGASASGNGSAATLTYSGLIPPEPAVGSLSHYRYRLRVRASNSSATAAISVAITVTQSSYSWNGSVSIDPTSNLYEYIVADSPVDGFFSSNPITLASGVPFSVTFTFPSGSSPWAFDDFILESEGIPR